MSELSVEWGRARLAVAPLAQARLPVAQDLCPGSLLHLRVRVGADTLGSQED